MSVAGRKRKPREARRAVHAAGSDEARGIVRGFIRQAERQAELGEARAAAERLRVRTRRKLL